MSLTIILFVLVLLFAINELLEVRVLKKEKFKSLNEKNNYLIISQQAKNYALANIKQNYYLKDSIMNQPEQRAYYFISDVIGDMELYKSDYYVFPQVSLLSFVELTPSANSMRKSNKQYFDSILRNVTSKNVDFLICKKEHKRGSEYIYIPKLVVEIDGPYHRSSSLTKQNDSFKDKLFSALQINVCRIAIEDAYDFDRTDIKNAILSNLREKN